MCFTDLIGKADNLHAVQQLLVHLLEERRVDLGQRLGVSVDETKQTQTHKVRS